MKALILPALLVSSGLANAHSDYWNSCVQTFVSPIGEESVKISKCLNGEELKLARKNYYFPLLSPSSRPVDYWEGSFYRTITVSKKFRFQIIDTCISHVLSTTESTQVIGEYDEVFSIENPNLDQTINASYLLSPLTESEAVKEYKKAEAQCEKYPSTDNQEEV